MFAPCAIYRHDLREVSVTDRILLALIAAGLWANVLVAALKPAPPAGPSEQTVAAIRKDMDSMAENLSEIEDHMTRQ
jgi:hypothetical protein